MQRRRAQSLPEAYSPTIPLRWPQLTSVTPSGISTDSPAGFRIILDSTPSSLLPQSATRLRSDNDLGDQIVAHRGVEGDSHTRRDLRMDTDGTLGSTFQSTGQIISPANCLNSQNSSPDTALQQASRAYDEHQITESSQSQIRVRLRPPIPVTPAEELLDPDWTSGEHPNPPCETNNGNNGAPEGGGNASPQTNHITLNDDSMITLVSRMTSVPTVWSIILIVGSTLLAVFTVYYVWNSAFDVIPYLRLLWSSPERTIFTINLLSYCATVVISSLVSDTFDQVRWVKSCTKNGIDFLSFLALSPAISILGLCHLFLSPTVPLLNSKFLSHRLWSLQRYYPLQLLEFIAVYSCMFSRRPSQLFFCSTSISTRYTRSSPIQ